MKTVINSVAFGIIGIVAFIIVQNEMGTAMAVITVLSLFIAVRAIGEAIEEKASYVRDSMKNQTDDEDYDNE